MAVPDSYFLEIEFTAGVWTDVTSYTDGNVGATTQYGRTTQYGPPQAASFSITLANSDGRFTPLRQTLSDGVTVHPYYPNLVPRKRIRWGFVKAAVRYIRFTGYITGWPIGLVNGSYKQITITAIDRSLQLQKFMLQQPIREEVDYWFPRSGTAGTNPPCFHYWPMTDVVGSTSAVAGYGAVPLTGANPPVFGNDGPGVGNGTAATFDAAVLDSMSAQVLLTSDYTAWAWIKPNMGAPAIMTALGFDDGSGSIDVELRLNASSRPEVKHAGGLLTAPSAISNGQWALIGVSVVGVNVTLWVNGISVATGVGGTAFTTTLGEVRIGREAGTSTHYFTGSIGHAAIAVGLPVFTATDMARLYAAGQLGSGETVDARIARLIRYANLAPADYNLDASTVTLSTFEQSGKTPFDAGQELIDSEGGGSALYVDTDDRVRFVNRDKTRPAAPALTLDAVADLDGDTWEPAYDADNLVNSSVGSRAALSGTLTTQSVIDTTSSGLYGPASGDFTSYSQSDADVLANAQSRVAAGRTPGFRLSRVAVNLVTAQSNLWAAAAAVRIGDRIRITNIPAGAAPATQVDLIVQGWADSYSTDRGYVIAFDTTPADNPAWFVWSDATTVGSVTGAYGRWQCSSQVLNGAITAAATTLIIASPSGPTFTTNAAMYPLVIAVGTEHIQLNSAPGGAVSPQTFTGCTRGVDGTTASAQATGSAVDLAPTSTWTL